MSRLIQTQLRPDTVVHSVPGQHEMTSLQSEAAGHEPEELPIGGADRQVHTHAADVARDDGPEL